MIKLTPILLAVAYALVIWHFSAWRLKHDLNAKSAPLADPALRKLCARMADALGVDQVTVHLYETEAINGLAAPDGRIFITRGFYQKYRAGLVSAEEMASVIAHELGHVALGHARRRMIDFSGQNALRVVVGGVLARLLPIGFVAAALANALASLLAASLSRADEYEADAYAAALLTRSGIGTAAQKSLFAKLARLTGATGRAGLPAWALSHPDTADRIRAIEALEAKWQGGGQA